MRGRIVFVTGTPDAGKTQVCRRVAELARHKGLRVSGLITEARRLASGRIVQTVVNLRTGERRRLADYVGVDEGEPIGRGVAGRFSWTFVGDSVRWGRHELARCQSSSTDLLIIDQLGPLEMMAGSGWANAVDVLRAARFDVALVVVNPLVLGELHRRLGSTVVAIEVGETTRDLLPSALIGLATGRSMADHPFPMGGPDVLAADLDGTLVFRGEGEGGLTPGVSAAVLEAQRAGVEIVVCTGRPTTRALEAAEALGLSRGSVISYGGAETRDLAGDRVVSRVPLAQDACATLEGIAVALDLDVSPHESPAGTLRLVITGETRQIEDALLAVAESLGEAVRVLRPAPGVIAVQHAAATKLDALRALAGRLRVDPAGVTYLGDDADDASALAWAGFGVAVVDGDGVPEAVDAADLIVAPAQVPELLVQLALARRLRDAG